MATTVLSFERMFALRALTLGVYMLAFYILTDVAKVPALSALCIIVAVSAWTVLPALRWRDKNAWFDIIATTPLSVLFCGTLPYVVTNDTREPNAPDWSGFPFVLCASEAAFFLSARGAFGEKIAEPSFAMATGVTMFMVQVSVLAAGFQFSKRRGS